MKGKIAKVTIIVLIIVALMIPIILDSVSKSVLETIEYSKLSETIGATTSYDFRLVYVAPSSSETINDTKKEVKETVEAVTSAATQKSLTAVYMDYDALSSSEKNAIFGTSSEKTAYMFIVNGELLNTVVGAKSTSELSNYVKAYSGNTISTDLANYKIPENAEDYEKLVNRKKTVTMAVFGRDSCFYCNQFKAVYNVVAKEKDLDIYYINSDTFNSEEYNKIMDLGLKIPASCSSTGKEVDLQPGFGTPLTLFTKNGKVIDCIDGYINKSTLITKLETVGMLETGKDE